MNTNLSEKTFEKVQQQQVVATVVVADIHKALPLAQTLLETGIGCIELTLRTDCAIKAIELISRELPEMLIGAGTVLTTEQAQMVKDAGGQFAVSPGLNIRVLEKSLAIDLPFAPGVCTPSDIETALEFNLKYLKFFPSEPLGGIKYLKCMAAPYMHRGIKFMPLGGINENNFTEYLKQDYIFAVGGSWLAPSGKISDGNWNSIKELCNATVSKIKDKK